MKALVGTAFGFGQYCSRFLATALKRSAGILLPGKGCRLPSAPTCSGSYSVIGCPAPFLRSEKSPALQASIGTVPVALTPLRARTLCSLKKKKVRFRPL